MTDAEIIKGTECCSSKKIVCSDCPYYGSCNCIQNLGKDTIDLINRQKAEIENLQKENNLFADLGKMYSEIKAEARKEFAERLKKVMVTTRKDINEYCHYETEDYYIDNLVKEMAGDTE